MERCLVMRSIVKMEIILRVAMRWNDIHSFASTENNAYSREMQILVNLENIIN